VVCSGSHSGCESFVTTSSHGLQKMLW
jgi:hypothetical protein